MRKMIINPDMDYRREILAKIRANDGYCPCAIVKSADTKCKCKEMKENNICECSLWVEEK